MTQAALPVTHDTGQHELVLEHEHQHEHAAPSAGVSNTKLAMWVFLSSDCLFFGAFISTYLLYRNRDLTGPTPKSLYNIPFTSVTSFILLMSSLTMVLALAAIQRGDHRRFRVWVIATASFGMLFIGGQVFEFTEFYRHGLTLSTNVSGSIFFVATGIHGLTSPSELSGCSPSGGCQHRASLVKRNRRQLRSQASTGTLWMLYGLLFSPSST